LKFCRLQWQKESKRSIDLWVAEQLKKIDVLEAEYWNAWIKSQKEKKSSSVKSRGSKRPKRKGDNGNANDDGIIPTSLEKWEKREERLGDPRYLDGFYSCIIARLKILGREGPDKDDMAKETSEKIRETISDIDSLMDIEPDAEELEEAGAVKDGK
jgi:hypothetical protein